jgi:Protein of unknown function (DUF1302)
MQSRLKRAWPATAGSLRPLALAAALVAGTVPLQAQAFGFELPEGWTARWDNTLKYSNAFRLKGQSAVLTSNPNLDDGDRNFDRGLISNRLDLLSEFDVQRGGFGARLSGAAWYDQVYNRHNDNPGFAGGAFPNQAGAADRFTTSTRNLHGRKAELLDWFTFGKVSVGGMNATYRLGQHAIIWGESLFFGANGIAGGMAPADVTKAVSVPGTQFKEITRPVPQLSMQLGITPDVSVAAYYQFRYQANRLPAVGSYFSQGDTNVDGGQQLLLAGPGSPFAFNAPRDADLRPKHSGQGGVKLSWRAGETDVGLYAIRFHSKSFQQVTRLVGANGFVSPAPGSYYIAYHEGIKAYGLSASRTFGSANVAAEVSMRTNQDLASSHAADASALSGGFLAPNDNAGNPAYAVGKTAHVNLSTLWTLDPNALFTESGLTAELAWNRVLSCTRHCAVYDPVTHLGTIDPNATRDAYALRMVFEPSYRQVLPGLDLSVPLGLGYAPRGSRSMALGPGAFPAENAGDMSLGVNGAYLGDWRFSLAYTHFFGAAKTFLDANSSFTYGQGLKDRDFIAMSLRRTF